MEYIVGGTGINTAGNYDPNSVSVFSAYNQTGNLTLLEAKTVTSTFLDSFDDTDLLNPFPRILTLTSTLNMNAAGGLLGIDISQTLTGPITSNSTALGAWNSSGGLWYSDEITLRWTKTVPPIPLPGPLYSNVSFDGTVTGSTTGGNGQPAGFGDASIGARVSVGSSYTDYSFDKNALLNPTDNTINVSLRPVAEINLDSHLHGQISYGFQLNVTNHLNAAVSGNFDHTMKLASITFADGTTPESLGYAIDFDSGIQSPNLQPVATPEPSSLALFASAALPGLVYIGWRRRKQPAAA